MRHVVFTGPTLNPDAVGKRFPALRVEPPIARGDLDRLRAEGETSFVVIDGVFAHRLAVAPSEIVRALEAGSRVLGAASLGAIRACECWPAGMQGSGAVYRLYRLRVISNDDEVAVATDPSRQYRAVSVALVNVRYAALAGLRQGLLSRRHAGAMLAAAKRMHFAERQWATILSAAGLARGGRLEEVCRDTDVKRRDALRALEALPPPERAPAGRRPGSVHSSRTRPHHPFFGYAEPELQAQSRSWLLGSGRHRRYGAEADTEALWSLLERTGVLESELLRWLAVRCWGARAGLVLDPEQLARAQAELARAHGFADWTSLLAAEQAGRLTDGVAVEWVVAAARSLARARQAAGLEPVAALD